MAPGRPFNNGYNKKQEDFPDDKPTDPPDNEKMTLVENSKSEFFKRKRIELTNLPNDPRPEDIHQTLFKDYPVSNVTVTDRNTARVTFVDSASAKRAIDTVNGALFSGNKIFIAYAPPDNFLFLGNLALSIDEGILEDMLGPFGKVSRAFLLRSLKTGYMKGCGFVEFENRDDAKNAKESLTGRFLRGRIVRTDWAPLVLNTYEDLHSRTLFIDRIPKDLFDSSVLREMFSQCGKVLFCDIAINPANGESRGFGFVDFDNADTAEKAQRMFSNYQIGNSQLRLAFGVPGRTGAHTLRQQSNSVGLNDLGGNKPQQPPQQHHHHHQQQQQHHHQPTYQPNKPHYQKPYERKPDTRTCYNCQQKGHLAKDCPRNHNKPTHHHHHHQHHPPPINHPPQPHRPAAPAGPTPQPPQPGIPPQPPAYMGAPPVMPPAMPGMPMVPGVPFVPGMPPVVPQYPGFYPGYPGAAPPATPQPAAAPAPTAAGPQTTPAPAAAATPAVPQALAAPVYQPPPAVPNMTTPAPTMPAPTATPASTTQPPTLPAPPTAATPALQPNAASAVSHQTHLPIQPQQPAPTPVPDNTAQLLQLQTQIQQAAQNVQQLGQQATQAYSQAQQAPTNELRNQYYQQYTQIYQQQQRHQQLHNNLVSQHTSLLRGSGTATAAQS